MPDFEFHPLAELFPLIEGAEFAALVVSIKESGQREAIVTLTNKILDGRNRYRACLEAGVMPITMPYTGADPVKFVLDMNLRRRHLNESQRAMIAAALCTLAPGQRADYASKAAAVDITTAAISATAAAAMLNVSRDIVVNAKRILNSGTPEEIAGVKEGKLAAGPTADKVRARVPRKPGTIQEERTEIGRQHAQIYQQARDAMDALSGLPHPADVARLIRTKPQYVKRIGPKIPMALKWVVEFSEAWNRETSNARNDGDSNGK
jgi:hypothetical protein